MVSIGRTKGISDISTNGLADNQPAGSQSGGEKYESFPNEVEPCHEETELDQAEPGRCQGGPVVIVQAPEFQVLRVLDTGQGAVFIRNAEALGIEPDLADTIVLSHGHCDHSGGLPLILRRAGKADLYCHPAAVCSHYSLQNGTARGLRMPSQSLIALDRQGLRPDPIADDLALWIRTAGGLIVVVGCAHAGLVNTLCHARHCNDAMPIRAVIGGFHLLNASPRRMQRTIDALRQFSPQIIVPCHCTGDDAVAALHAALGDRVSPGAAGSRYVF